MVGVADDCTAHYTLQSELQQWMLSLLSSAFIVFTSQQTTNTTAASRRHNLKTRLPKFDAYQQRQSKKTE